MEVTFHSKNFLTKFACKTKAPAKRSQHANTYRNMLQHVVCVWPPCCDMLGVVGSNLTILKLEPTTPNTLQHIATRWPKARNMLRHRTLRYATLARCDRLAGALQPHLLMTANGFVGRYQLLRYEHVSLTCH